MLITPQVMDAIFKAFNFSFNEGLKGTPAHWDKVATEAPSNTEEELYPWMGQWPAMREWVGDRVLNSLEMFGYAIKNKKFESTVTVPRTKIEDDRFNVFKGAFINLGRTVKMHPDLMVFGLLREGFTSDCYDGQNFFDTDHPVRTEDGHDAVVSNMQAGDGPGWYLLDTTQGIKPLIWQTRIGYEFQQMTSSNDERVFLADEYTYGVRARVNAGFGLWQLAYGSKASLTPDNYAAARQSMAELRGDRGQILGVTPSLLVVPPSLEKDARTLLKATSIAATTNVWHESADLLVTPFVA